MDATSLTQLADEQLAAARQAPAGRSSHTAHGGREHALRQTLVALTSGQELAEHNSPGEATLQVVRGRVRLLAGDDTCEGGEGGPRDRSASASPCSLYDAAVLLTVSMTR